MTAASTLHEPNPVVLLVPGAASTEADRRFLSVDHDGLAANRAGFGQSGLRGGKQFPPEAPGAAATARQQVGRSTLANRSRPRSQKPRDGRRPRRRTNDAYAEAYLGADAPLSADAFTVHPYLGIDAMDTGTDVVDHEDRRGGVGLELRGEIALARPGRCSRPSLRRW